LGLAAAVGVDDGAPAEEQAPRASAATTAMPVNVVTRLNLEFIVLPHFVVDRLRCVMRRTRRRRRLQLVWGASGN
jgi:hypothetical protein